MSKYLSYEDELDQLIDKVENIENTNTWQDMVDELGLDVHPDVLRKSFTGGRYGGYKVAKYYKNQHMRDSDCDEIDRLETLRDEIQKERIKLSDQNRIKKNMLRDEARFEQLLSVLKDNMKSYEPIRIKNYNPKLESSNRVTGVLQFSDWHVLKVIDNQFNLYNKDVAVERVTNIVDKAIMYSDLHNVTDLVVEVNGDIIEGLIQISSRNGEEADVISQILFQSDLLTNAIQRLVPYYDTVKVVTTLGNHGRIYADKKMGYTHENFEMLIPEFLRLKLGNSVKILTSHGMDFTSYEIDGDLICVAHGQCDSLANVISNFTKMYKRVPKEIHLGHFHSYKDINDCDIIVTVNGSLMGTDDYAIKLRKITQPSQNFIVYNSEDRCIYQLSAE